jgi:hypothetical protein
MSAKHDVYADVELLDFHPCKVRHLPCVYYLKCFCHH